MGKVSESIDGLSAQQARAVERLIDDRMQGLEAQFADKVCSLEARIAAAETTDRVTLVAFSGDMDRLMAAFIIATGAAAMGSKVSMFFSFWGLTAIKKQTLYKGKSVSEKLISMMLPTGPDSVGTSNMNMLGMGPLFFKHLMKKQNVQSLPELVALAQELGVELVACQMSMDVMAIKAEELLDGVAFGGVATYLGNATDSRLTLFI